MHLFECLPAGQDSRYLHGQNCVVSLTGKKFVLSACIFECGSLPTTYTSTSLSLTYEHSQAFLLCHHCFPSVYICEHKPKDQKKKKKSMLGTKLPIVHVHLQSSFTAFHYAHTQSVPGQVELVFRAATLCTAFFSPMSSMQLYADIKNSMQPSPAHLLHTLNLRIRNLCPTLVGFHSLSFKPKLYYDHHY